MKACYILETKGEEVPPVYRFLHRLCKDLGKVEQYQTFRRTLKKDGKFTNGEITIRKSVLI